MRKKTNVTATPIRSWVFDSMLRISPDTAAGKLSHATPKLSVAFLLLPEFTLLAFSGFIEALRHAADEWDHSRQINCRWTILSHDLSPIRASCGIEVKPWATYCEPKQFNYIVVVGGLLRGHERISSSLYDFVKLAAGDGIPIVALCTGSFMLARAGLVNGRRCCVHWYHLEEFENAFPKVHAESDKLFVIDGPIITSAGGGGVIDLAIALIESSLGPQWASKCITQMVFDETRRHTHPQSRLSHGLLARVCDPNVRRAIMMMEHHIYEPLKIPKIAKEIGTSIRQLERAFISELGAPPSRYARDLRLNYGKWLLANTPKPITQIAIECGFCDASYFSKCFRGHYGMTPKELRSSST
jgi:transcriptional regulator GlxA family with amidase domain